MTAPEPPAPETLAFIGTSDLSGSLRGVALPWAELQRLMGRGVVLPGHVPLRHPADPVVAAPDLLLLPDPATRAYVPAAGAPDLVLLSATSWNWTARRGPAARATSCGARSPPCTRSSG